MQQSRGSVWGSVLVVTGLLWLLVQLGYVSFSDPEILRFWPVLLILAGVARLFARRSVFFATLSWALIFAALVGAVRLKGEEALGFPNGSPFRWEGDSDNDGEIPGRRRSESQLYAYEMEEGVKNARLNFRGGAGKFRISSPGSPLFKGETKSTVIDYISNMKMNKADGSASIEFSADDAGISPGQRKLENTVTMSLNAAPVWTLDFAVGAGKGDFDLSRNKVRQLNLSTGISDVKIRLGDLSEAVQVNIESGVASVEIMVPETSGCRIRIDGAVNKKDLNGFEKVENGMYQTPGYEAAERKINISCDAGVSSVKVKRY